MTKSQSSHQLNRSVTVPMKRKCRHPAAGEASRIRSKVSVPRTACLVFVENATNISTLHSKKFTGTNDEGRTEYLSAAFSQCSITGWSVMGSLNSTLLQSRLFEQKLVIIYFFESNSRFKDEMFYILMPDQRACCVVIRNCCPFQKHYFVDM